MTQNGMNTSPNRKDMLLGCFILTLLFVPALASGVWLQKQVLGIYSIEERLDAIESKLSK